jgi:hypothetical protein
MNQIQGPQFIFQLLGSTAPSYGTLRGGVALQLFKNTPRYAYQILTSTNYPFSFSFFDEILTIQFRSLYKAFGTFVIVIKFLEFVTFI